MEKQNTPQLRFPEFSGGWEEKKYSDVFTFRSTNSYSRDKLNYESGAVKNIHYGDIHTKFNSAFDIENENVPYINKNVDLNKVPIDNYCKEGDLIVADASEDYNDIGKCIEIVNLNNQKVLAGLHTFLVRPELFKVLIGFNGYLMQSNKVRQQIKLIAQGTKVLSISTKRLGELNLDFPTLPEQQKIAAFLSATDKKLQQLHKKKTLLNRYKKGMMQKVFSKQIRFKDNNGKEFAEWDDFFANKVFVNYSNKNHDGDLPILSASQTHGMVLRDDNGIKIQASESSVKSYKIVDKGDFVISLRSFQGGIEYSEIKGICSPAYIILKPIVRIDNTFFKHYFKWDSFIERLSKTVVGIRDGKQITYDNFSSLKLPLPSPTEQSKIADFLTAIDDKIAAVNSQIDNAKAFKKGLLQQMFV